MARRATSAASSVRLVPAGHILGTAQVVLEHGGTRIVVSGDYKRRPDPTCPPFEPVPCDVFVTEATFGLPVFRHPADAGEIDKLLHSLALFPERTHLVGVYALGKCQRVLALLRAAGLRGADLSAWRARVDGARSTRAAAWRSGRCCRSPASRATSFAGEIVLAPPSAVADAGRGAWPIRWRRWPRAGCGCEQRAKQRGVELPLVISDHADWDELIADHRARSAPAKSGSPMAPRKRWCARRADGLRGAGAVAGRLRGRGGVMERLRARSSTRCSSPRRATASCG